MLVFHIQYLSPSTCAQTGQIFCRPVTGDKAHTHTHTQDLQLLLLSNHRAMSHPATPLIYLIENLEAMNRLTLRYHGLNCKGMARLHDTNGFVLYEQEDRTSGRRAMHLFFNRNITVQ